jgi:Fe-S cluster assembly iron-binding protein IscA
MLALTDSAVQAVQEILSSSEDTLETGGLRLVAELAGTQTNFQLSVVALPGEDDEVIEEEGACVFLDPEAVSLLEDKILDASVEPNQVEGVSAQPRAPGKTAPADRTDRSARCANQNFCALQAKTDGLDQR